MNNKLTWGLLTGMAIILFCFSCKKEKKDDVPVPEFDRKAMLTNIGNNIIVSNYQVLQTESNEFSTTVSQFNTTPDSVNLVALRTAFKEVYNAWQLCSVFEFGPGETELLRASVNIFPTDTTQINSNVSSGVYDLSTAPNADAKGFPAIDYLLFGTGANLNNILSKYTTDINAGNRKAYLAALSNEIKTKINSVYNAWSSSGSNYINTFINNSGTDVGSALGELVNQLNYDFETLKNIKIGIPLGKKTLGSPLPGKTEAYYSQLSVELILKNINAIQNIYLGRDELGNDGQGLDDYLVFLNARYMNGTLSDAIKNQFSLAINKLQQVPAPLSVSVVNNAPVVEAAYVELQKLVVLIKTDMPSAMGILITYQDNDGD
jgi:predicted lipoprotein